ncbi:Terpene cyclase DEP1-like protein [Cladobotryum mycophilum]|uniref:Terpene cyclase DEP1-like protein n=1 Tax=Cladobotryum mycophilum TaxID=491253 RepID=A0ABR0T3S9_9HYPO
MALPDVSKTFGALAGLGLVLQWAVMAWNGSLFAIFSLPLGGVFPTGIPIKTTWTGIWLIDYVLSVNIVFFGVLNNLAELPDLGPYLSLLDIAIFLIVLIMIPALWQFYRSYGGVGFTSPIYLGLYLKSRSGKCSRVPADQAQALPLTAIWIVVISSTLFAPAILGGSSFDFQDAVVVWHVAPVTLGIFQDLASLSFRSGLYAGFESPVKLSYLIVGSLSAVGHIAINWCIFQSPELTWSRVFWPDHSTVQDGVTLTRDGATLFLQYDHAIINVCIIIFGSYMLKARTKFVALVVFTLIAGPGGALAWILYQKESELDNEANVKKMVY